MRARAEGYDAAREQCRLQGPHVAPRAPVRAGMRDGMTGHRVVAPAAGRIHRVLVVDDNPVNRRVAEIHLGHHPLDVVTAPDGRAALELLAAQPFDLVLLDGMMPGMDGGAVAREVRRREQAAGIPAIPIVALTASPEPEDRQRMLAAGMDDHVVKPLRPAELAAVLARWLGPVARTSTIPPPAPGSPAALTAAPGTRARAPAAPVLDLEVFGRLSDLGDATFVERIVRLFLADAAERVGQVDEALETGNAVQLRRALHALEGICGNIGATALNLRARELHDQVRRREDRGDDPAGPVPGPSGLEQILGETRVRLRERLSELGRP